MTQCRGVAWRERSRVVWINGGVGFGSFNRFAHRTGMGKAPAARDGAPRADDDRPRPSERPRPKRSRKGGPRLDPPRSADEPPSTRVSSWVLLESKRPRASRTRGLAQVGSHKWARAADTWIGGLGEMLTGGYVVAMTGFATAATRGRRRKALWAPMDPSTTAMDHASSAAAAPRLRFFRAVRQDGAMRHNCDMGFESGVSTIKTMRSAHRRETDLSLTGATGRIRHAGTTWWGQLVMATGEWTRWRP